MKTASIITKKAAIAAKQNSVRDVELSGQ